MLTITKLNNYNGKFFDTDLPAEAVKMLEDRYPSRDKEWGVIFFIQAIVAEYFQIDPSDVAIVLNSGTPDRAEYVISYCLHDKPATPKVIRKIKFLATAQIEIAIDESVNGEDDDENAVYYFLQEADFNIVPNVTGVTVEGMNFKDSRIVKDWE